MYKNKGDKLKEMPKVLSLREQLDAAARGAIVLPDMARRNDGITEWLLPENVRGITSAELYQLQRSAQYRINNVRDVLKNRSLL